MRRVCYLYLVLLCGLLVGGAALFGFLLASIENIKQSERFTRFNPALPTRILDIRGDLITEFSSDEKREIVSFADLSSHLVHALLTREDRSFYTHHGYSIKAIFRALVGTLTGRALGGGSTLTQQIAGLLYSDRSDRSLRRKIKELWWALHMERRYSKNEIMELYLNRVYFGGGTYGVGAAARFYFGHSVRQMSAAEAALLVILLSNPAHYNPFEYPNRAQDRQRYVLHEMTRLGYLSEQERDESYEHYWAHFDYTRTTSSAFYARADKARWFSEYVRRQLDRMMYGTMNLYQDGYTVHTTCDLRHQLVAEQQVEQTLEQANAHVQKSSLTHVARRELYSNISELLGLVFNVPQLHVGDRRMKAKSGAYYRSTLSPLVNVMALMFGLDNLKTLSDKGASLVRDEIARKRVEGALIALENDTGYITALVGGSRFGASNQVIRATQGLLQPGSVFKPLVYSAALDSKKLTMATQLHDAPQVFSRNGVSYIPNNYGGKWQGVVLAWKALAQSLNIPAIRVLDMVGFDAVIQRAATLLHITDRQEIERTFPRVYPLALGVVALRPIQLARAFAAFGNGGKAVEPIAVRSVEDRLGRVILDPEREVRARLRAQGAATQLISAENAALMTNVLEKTVTMGTLAVASERGRAFTYQDPATGRSFVMPVAGKTGTTQNWSDAWAVGYSPYYTAVLWFGFDKGDRSLGLHSTGATLASPPWARFMRAIHQDKPHRAFVRPETGLMYQAVCAKSGLLPTPYCGDELVSLSFLPGTVPERFCSYHESGKMLEELAKERLKESGYSTGFWPAVSEEGLHIDPRVFEDPPLGSPGVQGEVLVPSNPFAPVHPQEAPLFDATHVPVPSASDPSRDAPEEESEDVQDDPARGVQSLDTGP